VIFGTVARRVGKQHFGSVTNNAAALLLDAGHEPRHVNQRYQWDIEDIAEPYEPCRLVGGIDIERSRFNQGIVGDNAGNNPLDTGKTNDDVSRESLVDFEEVSVIGEAFNDLGHIERILRAFRDQFAHFVVQAHIDLGRGMVGRIQ
jgi:hypothetical protein